MEKFTITSIQAPNQDWIAAALANYLGEKLETACEFIADPPWQERERMIDSGYANIGWICGLPYVHKIDWAGVQIELLVAIKNENTIKFWESMGFNHLLTWMYKKD